VVVIPAAAAFIIASIGGNSGVGTHTS